MTVFIELLRTWFAENEISESVRVQVTKRVLAVSAKNDNPNLQKLY